MEFRPQEDDPFKARLVGYQYPIYNRRRKLRQMHWADLIELGLPQEQWHENQYRCLWTIPDHRTYYFDQKGKESVDLKKYHFSERTC